MKKNTSLRFLCVCFVILTAATGLLWSNGSQEQAMTTITFWHHYSEQSAENQVLQEILIPEFERQNPDIKVKASSYEWAELHQKVLVSTNSGMLPDVLRADSAWIPEFHELGILLPMSTTFNDFDKIHHTILEGPMATAKIDGVYYGLGLNTNSKIMFYNTKLLKEAGITPPKTLDELFTAAEKLTRTTQGKHIWGYGEPALSGWNLLPFIWSNGGDILNKAQTKASGYLDSQKNIDLITHLAAMYKDKYWGGFTSGSIPMTDGFAQGRYAMIIDGPWKFAELIGGHKEFTDYDVALMPAGDGGSIQVLGGEDITICNEANKNASWEFVKFMTGYFAQTQMANAGQIPVNIKAIDSPEVRKIPNLGLFLDAIKTAKARPALAEWSKIDEIITLSITSTMLGEDSASHSLSLAAQEIDNLLMK